MIITRTPFRMSFFGGGSDIEDYFKIHNGSVLSATFDKYVYVTVRHLPRFFSYSTELLYSVQERVSDINDIKHPMVRNAMKFMNMHELHIAYDADLPARTGLGTSSSFAVGLLNAFYAMKNKSASKDQLAKDAIYVERVLCNEAGGWQDQIAVSYGGMNRIDFSKDGYKVSPIKITAERLKKLNDNLMLFFTGYTRLSFEIQKNVKQSIKKREDNLNKMVDLVNKAQKVLECEKTNIDEFGILLDETWHLKKSLDDGITTSKIDEFYNAAIKAGALGGKLLGAGGGGFLLFYVPQNKQNAVRKALRLMEVPFNFENNGSEILLALPENYDIGECLEK